MTLNLTIPQHVHTDFTPRITVIGVGGGGTNAVDNMIAMNLQGVEFIVANTDAQQLMHSRADRRIQLGPHITQGLGAGAKPEVGRAAAEEAAEELMRHLEGVHMVFITAGMGGGTGTGAAPVIARMARERDILTVGVVTKPFRFEGNKRARAAEEGIAELTRYVDTLIVIPNQNLFLMANERTGWREAFKMADNVLYKGVRGVTDLMVAPGLVNLDFADIRTVMAEMGTAMMGTGEAEGEGRALRAAEMAIQNPLLEQASMGGARGLLINITGGEDLTLFEVDEAATRIRREVDDDANIIFGSAIDESLNGRVVVSVVATGIQSAMPMRDEERPRLVVNGSAPLQVVSNTSVTAPATSTAPLSLVPDAAPSATPIPARPQPGPATNWAAPPRPAEPPMSMGEVRVAPPIDNTPLPPRPIPKHLQTPVTAQPLRPKPGARPTGNDAPAVLFADQPASPPPRRQSLFAAMTGVFRSAPAPEAPVARAPAPVQAEFYAEDAPDGGHGVEPDLDIPTFLRQQRAQQAARNAAQKDVDHQ